jgi:predicted ATPase
VELVLFRLEIENFYSIRDEQIIDLVAGKAASEDLDRLAPMGPAMKERVPKVVAIFGPNASGKSTVLRALSFLSWFVRESFLGQPNQYLPFHRFLHQKAEAQPTRLAVWFAGPPDPTMIGEPSDVSCKYAYELTLGGPAHQPPQVLSESLKFWSNETKRQVVLFHRNGTGTVKGHKSFGLAGYHSALEKILRPDVSVISTLAQLKHEVATKLWYASNQLVSNILIEKSEPNDDAVARVYESNPELLQSLNNEIERIDFGIQKLSLVSGKNGPVFSIRHNGLASDLLLPFESHGTRQFIKTFPLLFKALLTGGVAVIDELDLSIHPLVLPEILRWFHDKDKNPHDAQLWITSQGASLLEELIKEEIFFCEKDSAGRTSVYGLRDIQSVRRTDNFYRKYLGGVYGAIPRLG